MMSNYRHTDEEVSLRADLTEEFSPSAVSLSSPLLLLCAAGFPRHS